MVNRLEQMYQQHLKPLPPQDRLIAMLAQELTEAESLSCLPARHSSQQPPPPDSQFRVEAAVEGVRRRRAQVSD
jgi:hypothetical protein